MSQYQSFPDAAGDSLTLEKLKALRLPSLEGCSFLDVGCNEGFFCGFAYFQGARPAVGIDQSKHFIERARRRFPACEFHLRGWDSLPDGPFEVILLASALHYAEDQPALIASLVDRLSATGTLVLEMGIASSRKVEWVKVKRGIDERLFPSMPLLRKILAGYAWKWMGPSVSQDGDPVLRHVIHISRRRPVAYLLMQPPGYGKSSIASGLFTRAGIQVISGDETIGRVAKGRSAAPAALGTVILEGYSPFRLDETISRIFELGLGADLVSLWLEGAGNGDIAIDVFVPSPYHGEVERLLTEHGYMPVQLQWERVGPAPLPAEVLAGQAEDFYLSLLGEPSGARKADARRNGWQPGGFVDELSVRDGCLIVRGWAIDANGSLPDRISVKLGRRTIELDRIERQLRPDVQRHMGLPHALVGYKAVIEAAEVHTASDLGRNFKIFARDGRAFQLAGQVEAIFRSEIR